MARAPRVEVPGGVYHVIARGNERRDIFRDDADRRMYLARLAECRKRYEFGVLAYCLMPNHVHLAVERGPVPLSKIMLALHFFYSQKFNWRHERTGHLFQGRYKAYLVEHERYLEALVRYIHLNPVKGGIVDRPDAFPWSSDRYYRAGAGPPWLDLDFVLRRLAPTRAGACAAYRRSMGSDDPDAYEVVEAIGRVVKGGEDFAHRSMRHAYVVARRGRWTAPALARAASVVQGFSFQTLRGRTRGRPESRARIIAAFIGRRDHGVSTGSLAACFRRDESAFVHGLRRLELAMQRDPSVARHVERIASAIESQTSELQD